MMSIAFAYPPRSRAVGLHEVLDGSALLQELGFETTSNLCFVLDATAARTLSPGPDPDSALGSHDLVAVHMFPDVRANFPEHASGQPSHPLRGVPPAMKITSPCRSRCLQLVVKDSLPWEVLCTMSSSDPARRMGCLAGIHIPIFRSIDVHGDHLVGRSRQDRCRSRRLRIRFR